MSPDNKDRNRPHEIARLFDVPPWLVDGSYARPRFARLRWMLRRIWKIR
jgi:hypothetical protein